MCWFVRRKFPNSWLGNANLWPLQQYVHQSSSHCNAHWRKKVYIQPHATRNGRKTVLLAKWPLYAWKLMNSCVAMPFQELMFPSLHGCLVVPCFWTMYCFSFNECPTAPKFNKPFSQLTSIISYWGFCMATTVWRQQERADLVETILVNALNHESLGGWSWALHAMFLWFLTWCLCFSCIAFSPHCAQLLCVVVASTLVRNTLQGAIKGRHDLLMVHVPCACDALQDGAVLSQHVNHGICQGVDAVVVPRCTYRRKLVMSAWVVAISACLPHWIFNFSVKLTILVKQTCD